MRTAAIRLTLRLGRTELFAFGAVLIVLIVAGFLVSAWADSLAPSAACRAETGSQSAACAVASAEWYSATQRTGVLGGLLVFVSFAAALFLGVPIVARELERGTTRLAWSLAPSRVRWYLARILPILGILAVLTFLAGAAVDRTTGVSGQSVDWDPANDFSAFGYRGVLLACRAIFIFAVGVLVGSLLARSLPAIILATIVATVGLVGGERVHQMLLATEAVAVAQSGDGLDVVSNRDLWIDQKFQLPDGSLVDWAYFGSIGEEPYDIDGNPRYPIVTLVIPGERYRFVETRQAIVLLGGSAVALLGGAAVVRRRRPG